MGRRVWRKTIKICLRTSWSLEDVELNHWFCSLGKLTRDKGWDLCPLFKETTWTAQHVGGKVG